MSGTTRYPLFWPEGCKRTPAGQRVRAAFGRQRSEYDSQAGRTMYRGKRELSVWEAIRRLDAELQMVGVRTGLVSTNIPTRIDGAPRSGMREPDDPGAAVYWQRKGEKQCMAIDRYTRVADNIAAIAATLEALRAVERHGGGEILDRALAGFAQLAAAIITERPWREVLQFMPGTMPSMDEVDARLKTLAKIHHSDAGGSDEKMCEINVARDAARRELLGEGAHA